MFTYGYRNFNCVHKLYDIIFSKFPRITNVLKAQNSNSTPTQLFALVHDSNQILLDDNHQNECKLQLYHPTATLLLITVHEIQ